MSVSPWSVARLQSVQQRVVQQGQGLTLVHFSAQPEPFLSFKTSPKRLNTPSTPAINAP